MAIIPGKIGPPGVNYKARLYVTCTGKFTNCRDEYLMYHTSFKKINKETAHCNVCSAAIRVKLRKEKEKEAKKIKQPPLNHWLTVAWK